jgi:predicted nucleic-acid-binding protein
MTAIAIAEMVWVLSGVHYGFSRDESRQAIGEVLSIPGLQVGDSEAIGAALDIYAAHNVDFIDAYQAAIAGTSGMTIVSFDRDFDGIPGAARIEPAG